MTMAELDHYILNLITQYHNEGHSGLQEMTPLAKFLDGMRGTGTSNYPIGDLLIPADPVKLMLDFLPPVERVIGPQGVRIDYFFYMDDVLQRWVNAREPNDLKNARLFLFRQDPRDLTRIYFWDPEDRLYFIIPTRNLFRPSISKWEYEAVRQFLRERGVATVDEEIIFNAREERRQILQDATNKTKSAKHAREAERLRNAQEAAAKFLDKVAGQAGRARPADSREIGVSSGREEPASAPSVDTGEDTDTPAAPYTMNWDDA
jgi:putative transposase